MYIIEVDLHVHYIHFELYALLQASYSEFGLTSSEHVWILPSYYDPDWWKSYQLAVNNSRTKYKCTDEEMVQVLNSAIFVDAVKYPALV